MSEGPFYGLLPSLDAPQPRGMWGAWPGHLLGGSAELARSVSRLGVVFPEAAAELGVVPVFSDSPSADIERALRAVLSETLVTAVELAPDLAAGAEEVRAEYADRAEDWYQSAMSGGPLPEHGHTDSEYMMGLAGESVEWRAESEDFRRTAERLRQTLRGFDASARAVALAVAALRPNLPERPAVAVEDQAGVCAAWAAGAFASGVRVFGPEVWAAYVGAGSPGGYSARADVFVVMDRSHGARSERARRKGVSSWLIA